MDTNNATLPDGAKARRVYLSLRDDILNGSHAPGSVLPGEQKLAAVYEVSRVTIRRALDALSADGLVKRHAGSGTQVCPASAASKPVAMDFSTLMPQLAEMGLSTTARLLSYTYGTPPSYVAQAMGLDSNARMQIATRVRLADEQPFSYLTTYVPEDIASNYSETDLASTPLFLLLERGGVTINSAHQSVSAALASPEVAEALGVAVGSALLSLHRVVRDSKGRGVEYLSARYRPDLFSLDMELARVDDGTSRHWEPRIAKKNSKATKPSTGNTAQKKSKPTSRRRENA